MTNTVVLQQELQDAAFDCKTARNKAQEALKKLLSLADYPTPSTLAEVTVQRLTTFVTERINAVKKNLIYTQEQRSNIISDWIEWKTKAMPHVSAVETFVKNWPEVCPTLDTDTMSVATADIAESLTPRFTVEIPIQAHTHIALIHNVKQDINELREWEREQDTKKIPLERLLRLTENELFQSWSNGNIKVDHEKEDEFCKRWREANNANIL